MTSPKTDYDVDRAAARAAGEVAKRAIRRLNVLEWVILAVAGGLGVGAAALVAPLIAAGVGIPFRWAWITLSVFLFGVPGAIVLLRARREERAEAERRAIRDESSDG